MDKIAETKRAIRLREWSEMYRVYQSSGKTVSAWCTEQELSVKTFYYRLRKIRESALETTEKHEIVLLSPSPAAVPMQSTSCIKISGNGIAVELPENISAETITTILQGLKSC